MRFSEQGTETRRLTKKTLRDAENLTDQNGSPNSDKGGVRNDHGHGRVHGGAFCLSSSPRISSIRKPLPQAD